MEKNLIERCLVLIAFTGLFILVCGEITRFSYNHFLNKRYTQAYQKVFEMSKDFTQDPKRFVDRLELEPESESLESKLNILERYMFDKGVVWNNKKRNYTHYKEIDPNYQRMIKVPKGFKFTSEKY